MNAPVLNKKLIILAVVVSAFLGGNAAFAKLIVKEIPPFSFVFLRFLLSLIILFPIFLKTKTKLSKDLWKLILLSMLSTANIFLFALGVKFTTANIGQILYVSVPIVASVFAYFLLKERFSFKKIVGIIIGFTGAIIIVLIPLISTSQFKGLLLGNLLIATGVISYALYTVLSKSFQKKYSPVEITFFFFLTTTIVSLVFSFSDFIYYPNWYINVSFSSILAICYLAIFGTVLFYLLYQYIIKHSSPVTASTSLYLQPFATLMWAYLLLGEGLTPLFIVGGTLALLGTFLVTRS
ncbi:DMT family transporter, partial [Patescibacteria group bacterium]|nr:DMT family transporter [Patescibacteria group bacterium]